MRFTVSRRDRSSAFTLVELLVVITIIGILIALLLPAVQAAREAARRMTCTNQIKQLCLAVHNYTQANQVFPVGTIASNVDTISEAATGSNGTGWILRILPYMEGNNIFKDWDFSRNVAGNTTGSSSSGFSHKAGSTDIKALYCPSRRSTFRADIDGTARSGVNNLATAAGATDVANGTDYGGCAGRIEGWGEGEYAFAIASVSASLGGTTTAGSSSAILGAGSTSTYWKSVSAADTAGRRIGIFGSINKSKGPEAVVDGMSNTIMVGELQRIVSMSTSEFNAATGPKYSADAWPIGGICTLFSTADCLTSTGAPQRLMNNGDIRSPGGEHPGVVNFGFGDGSVRPLSDVMQAVIFQLLGSMADKTAVGPDSTLQ